MTTDLLLAEKYKLLLPHLNETSKRLYLASEALGFGRGGISKVSKLTQTALLTAVLNERRVELAAEGHRFFDLKRTGLFPSTVGLVAGQEFRTLLPLPLREIQVSEGVITQNPGY